MTIAAVSGQNGGAIGNNTTATGNRVYAGNVTAGSLLVFGGMKYAISSDAFIAGDLTKTAGTATIDTIVLDKQIAFDVGTGGSEGYAHAGMWSCLVTGTGSATFVLAGAPAGSYLLVASHEFTGTWDANRFETSITATQGTNSTTSGGSGNLTSAGGGLFVGVLQLNTTTGTAITPDGAFTTIYENETSTDNNGSMIYRIVSTGTTDAADWTFGSTNVGWAIAAGVYKEVGAATAFLRRNYWWDNL